ncbi:hypothetical protein OAO01_08940, partial [Oligoflexia bacterium]|nr:hypothetical protein [Oligoflexia bacterium]
KSTSVKIFVYALDKQIRINMIAAYKEFCDRCRDCYEKWKLGDLLVDWPPGAFLPAMPPRVNIFA